MNNNDFWENVIITFMVIGMFVGYILLMNIFYTN
jgi:hypothetical protein